MNHDPVNVSTPVEQDQQQQQQQHSINIDPVSEELLHLSEYLKQRLIFRADQVRMLKLKQDQLIEITEALSKQVQVQTKAQVKEKSNGDST